MIHSDPFLDHTLKLIQLNWVVITDNFNIEIVVNNLSVKYRYFMLTTLHLIYLVITLCISFISFTC
jgi:hypothetical protein